MRKMILNKWFFLATVLSISLSALSFIAYQKTHTSCKDAEQCCQKTSLPSNKKGELILEAVSRQFTSFISVQ